MSASTPLRVWLTHPEMSLPPVRRPGGSCTSLTVTSPAVVILVVIVHIVVFAIVIIVIAVLVRAA